MNYKDLIYIGNIIEHDWFRVDVNNNVDRWQMKCSLIKENAVLFKLEDNRFVDIQKLIIKKDSQPVILNSLALSEVNKNMGKYKYNQTLGKFIDSESIRSITMNEYEKISDLIEDSRIISIINSLNNNSESIEIDSNDMTFRNK